MKKEKDKRRLNAEIYWSAAIILLNNIGSSYGCCDAIRALANNAREKTYESMNNAAPTSLEPIREINEKRDELIRLFSQVYHPRNTPECDRGDYGVYWMEDYGEDEFAQEHLKNRRALAMCFMATLCLTGDVDDISQSRRN